MESGNTCSFCMGSGEVPAQSDVPKAFVCHICLEVATNAVVSFCGHMFCWPCLHQWLQNQERPCPVCKNMLRKGEIIPIYGGHEVSSSGPTSPADGSIPPRPNPLLPPRSASPRAASMEVSMEGSSISRLRRILVEMSSGDGGEGSGRSRRILVERSTSGDGGEGSSIPRRIVVDLSSGDGGEGSGSRRRSRRILVERSFGDDSEASRSRRILVERTSGDGG